MGWLGRLRTGRLGHSNPAMFCNQSAAVPPDREPP